LVVTELIHNSLEHGLSETGDELSVEIAKSGSTYTDTRDYPSQLLTIGKDNAGSTFVTGFMSNLRVVKGVGVYTGNFTTPTSPLTSTQSSGTNIAAIADTSTSLLTCQSATIIDNSSTPLTITNNGTTQVSRAYSPFGTQATILVAQGVAVTTDNSINGYTFTNVATVTQVSATPFVGPLTGSAGAGASTTAAIGSTGILYVSGLNSNGQIGDNTIINRSTPVQIGTLASTTEFNPIQVGNSSWSQVSAGDSHSVGIKLDNTVFAWGLNSAGQLGDSTTISRSSPVQVGTASSTLSNANAYSTYFNGSNHLSLTQPANAGIGDFTIELWIYPTTATLGTLLSSSRTSTPPSYHLQVLSSGAIRLYLNSGSSVSIQSVSPYLANVNSWTHIAIVRSGSTVRMYVNGYQQSTTATLSTQFGDTDTLDIGRYQPSSSQYYTGYISNIRYVYGTALYTNNFTVPSSPLTAISNTTLLICQNTTVIDNSTNNVTITNTGSVITGSLNTPFSSTASAGSIFATQISAGASHSAAIDSSNKLYMWGFNNGGELGLNDVASRSAPTQIGVATNWNSVSAGFTHTVATNSTGDLFVWGQNTGGMLGQNDQVNRSSPTQLTSLSLPNLSSPTQVGSSSYSFVCAGNNISTAISSTNKLFVWGLGTQGQLGVNLTVARSSPVQISSLSHNLVNAGGTHITLVSTVSPQLILSTGFNNSGQLGLSDTVSRSSPTQVAASATAFNSPVTVSVGNYSSYYVNSPIQVGSSSWTTVSAGGTHTIATKKDNTLFAWGLNNYGQLGGSNTINTSSPVQIGTSSWSQVSAGDLHNTIAKSDGTINTFGLNNFGQLGDGT
jgi:alpha-tubulin suppressor-like RCC1 family protein/two-component sensor histidine kinase